MTRVLVAIINLQVDKVADGVVCHCCSGATLAVQVWRVHERLTSPHVYDNTHHHYGRPDAGDNNWLLLECVLALPLALGLWTSQVSLLLCCALLGEAVMHWQWWERDMPSWHYRQNIRDHFFVNVAVAGGLALMQSFGGGVLTVDALLQKQK